MPDAVVIGAGPNGLVAANLLADAGWTVTVLEAGPEPGGAVRSGALTVPGFTHDWFSAFYPLAAASPVLDGLGLDAHGLRWRRAPLVLAHPLLDGRCPVLSTDLDTTAASVDAFAAGDGDAWRALVGEWRRIAEPLIGALFSPFPPVRNAARIAWRLGAAGTLRFARQALLPARRMGEEHFDGEGARLLLGGSALHTDLAPEAAGSGIYGWLMCMLGQEFGFPVPEGGAGSLSAALVDRLEARGGVVVCSAPVTEVVVRRGRAVGVRTAGGDTVSARRAVLADVAAPHLFGHLVDPDLVPASYRADLDRFQWDMSTVKVDWALRSPIPWTAPEARSAGTVHVADDFDNLTEFAAQLAMGRLASRPFLLMGQQSMTDPTRSPPGTETAWAYSHVPRTVRGDAGDLPGVVADEASWLEGFVARVEARVERLAPGFGDLIIGRHVFSPSDLERHDANLVGGAVGGGTSQLHQQLVFRPVPGAGRPETPVAGLYLASAGAHPGGGVHGAPGANAAHVALLAGRRTRSVLVGRASLGAAIRPPKTAAASRT